MKINEHSNRCLGFHNAVMWWKCSLLTDKECQEHQNRIEEHVLEKEEEIKQPWTATMEKGAEESSTENEYIQKFVTCFYFSFNDAKS